MLSVGAAGILLDVLSVELSVALLVVVDELSEVPFELDKVGNCGIPDGSFAQAASVIVNATTVMILHGFFMYFLLWINRPYHFCGNAAYYRQRRNVMSYHSPRRYYRPIAYCNSGEYRCV